MVRFSIETQQLTKNLIKEYNNDIYATYAAVHNNTIGSHPDKELIEVKQYLEYLMACEAMEEHFWERDEMGLWHFVTSDEFFSRWRAAREKKDKE